MSGTEVAELVHRLSNPCAGPRKLTQSVLQITTLLGMYQAELARVLRLRCGDIGQFAAGRQELAPDTTAWAQAQLFVRFYTALFDTLHGDGPAMCHWLRARHSELRGVPLLMMVDEDRLARVVDFLEGSTGS